MKRIIDIHIFKEIVPNFVIGSDPKRMSMSPYLADGSIVMVSKGLDSSKMLRSNSYDLNIELSDIMRRFSSRMKGEHEM